jgi:hypothetical protein
MPTDLSPIAVPPRIEMALRHASRTTGTDFDYLLDTAIRESGLKSDAKSKSSSATGLFQFIESTWLGMIKSAGEALGIGDLADKIERTPTGRYEVADRAARREILALRNDPETAAVVAGAYARDAERALEGQLGRSPSNGELYLAHFLGQGGARRMIDAVRATPDAGAAELFPQAAAANRSIFYGRGGKALTVQAVHDRLIAQHDRGPVRLAGADVSNGQAMPVISPAAASYLKPVNFGPQTTPGGRSWGNSLFTGGAGVRAGGPLVLDSARLVALIEESLAESGDRPVASEAGPAERPPPRRPLGLLERRAPLFELFRSG